jgi:hypothetical protein
MISDEASTELARESPDETAVLARLSLLSLNEALARGALPALSTLYFRSGRLGETARTLLRGTWYGHSPRGAADYYLHTSVAPYPETDARVGPAVAAVMGRELERLCANNGLSVEELERYHVLCLRHAPLAQRCTAPLLELVEREDDIGLEALRILAHLGSSEPIVRARYLSTMHAWTAFDEQSIARLPCWKHHDAETLAAFERVFDQVPDKWLFRGALKFSGLLDADTVPVVRKYFDSLGEVGPAWAWVESDGFRGDVERSSSNNRTLRVNWLAVEIATLRDHGLDFSKPENDLAAVLNLEYDRTGGGGYDDYVQWGFFHALSLKLRSPAILDVAIHYVELGNFPIGFGTHYDAATAFLEQAELSEPQQVRLNAALAPFSAGGDEWRGINIVDATHGGRPVGRVSLESVPKLRDLLYGGNVRALEELTRTTPLVPRDEEYLRAMLERAPQAQRLWAIKLVETNRLDSSSLRDAVRRRSSDADYEVREFARNLILERGW